MGFCKKKIVYKIKSEYDINTTDELLTLIGIYLSEWEHRDSMFWKEIITYFFATLVVMLLPFMNPWAMTFPEELPTFLFPCIGLIMTIAFFIISNAYIVRMKLMNTVYQDLINMLPPAYRRKQIRKVYHGIWGTILNCRMASFICYFMFFALTGIGTVLLWLTLV